MTQRWASPEAIEFAASMGVSDPLLAVRTQCRRLLDDRGGLSIPVRLNSLFEALDVRRVVPKSMPLEGGLKVVPEGGFTILVRADRSEKRRRFTIAHECGHILFHRFAPRAKEHQSRGRLAAPREEERLCNIAAEELLMPWHDTRAIVKRSGSNLSAAVAALAQDFDVSVPAAMIRAATATRLRGAVQLWGCKAGKWALIQSQRTGSCRLSLDSFVPKEWVWRFPAAVGGTDAWSRSGWLHSIERRADASALSGGCRLPDGRLLVHHILTQKPVAPSIQPLEQARRDRLRRARAMVAVPDCPLCEGIGHVWVAENTVAMCRCRLRGNVRSAAPPG